MTQPTAKRCCRCRKAKPRSAFHRRTSAVDGLQPFCAACALAYQRDGRRKGSELGEAAKRVAEAVERFEREGKRLLEALRSTHEAANTVKQELARASGER